MRGVVWSFDVEVLFARWRVFVANRSAFLSLVGALLVVVHFI